MSHLLTLSALRRLSIAIVLSVFILLFAACAEQDGGEIDADVDGEIEQTEDATTVDTRAEFEADILEQYNELQAGVMAAQARLDEMGEDVSAETAEAVAAFNTQMDAFGADFQRLQDATAEELDDAQAAATAGLEELNNAFGVMENAISNAYDDFVNRIDEGVDIEADVDVETGDQAGDESDDDGNVPE